MDWTDERRARLAVAWYLGFGSRTIRKLAAHSQDWTQWWQASRNDFLRIGLTERKTDGFLQWRSQISIDLLLEKLETSNICVLFPDDVDYPPSFLSSVDRPELLFVRGNIPQSPAIAMVGSRKMTHYGKSCTQQIAHELAQQGFVIVSGLALGIDGCAHEASLQAGQATVAVVGAGLDDASIYPQTHLSLAHKIIEQGAIISEFPPGTKARKEYFPLRNRLIAAFSLATVVVEADLLSGSLITAKSTLEEGKEVLAVPGSIHSSQSKGTHQLIQSGARLCTGATDVLDALHIDRPQQIAQARNLLPLTSSERDLLDKLQEPHHVDELIRLSAQPSAHVCAMLSTLEIKGFIRPTAPQIWVAV